MPPTILVANHQSRVEVDLRTLDALAAAAIPLVLEHPAREHPPLESLDEIEVSIVSDDTIADLHLRFMDMAGATDVITFEHGEIIVSADTAVENAKRFGTLPDREIALYIIHGLLHLNGHEDADEETRQRMHGVQEKILKELWPFGGNFDDSVA